MTLFSTWVSEIPLNGRYDEGVAGHITVRDSLKPDCFWVNPFGLHFKLIQPEDLLLVDHDGNILEESGPRRLLNVAAFMIHSGVHLHLKIGTSTEFRL